MAAQGNLLVKDDASTPVEHTLIPVTANPLPQWRDTVAGVPFEGQVRVQVVASERMKSGDYRRVLRVDVPVMETLGVSGTSAGYVAPPKVAYVETFTVTQYSSSRSTLADRANALKILVGLLQGASASSGTGTLDQASAGSAFGSSSAPVTNVFTNGVIPS